MKQKSTFKSCTIGLISERVFKLILITAKFARLQNTVNVKRYTHCYKAIPKIIHIDTIKLERGSFLTIVDSFSKYAQGYKLNSCESMEIANNLIKYFTHHCTPDQIISDNGNEFKNAVIKELLEVHKVKIHFISSQHPESVVERFHSTLIEHIRLFNNQTIYKNEPIEIKVNYAILAYNNTIHSATNLKPYEIVTGHLQTDSPFQLDIEKQLTNNYVSNHREKTKLLYQQINEKLQIGKKKTIGEANESKEKLPEIPERVFVKNKQKQSKTKNKYNPEHITKITHQLKTAKISPRHHKTAKNIRLSNIKRPRKTDKYKPLSGPSRSQSDAEAEQK